MKLLTLLLIAMATRLAADNLVLEPPLSATFKYQSGATVTLTQDVSSLAEVTVSAEKIAAKIPHEELKDIVNPELNKVDFTAYTDDETGKPRMDVTLRYNARPYEWGDGVSKVTFRFIAGEYHSRATTIPIGKNLNKDFEKKKGEAEQEFGESGSVKGVLESK
ncbi:hypothetical protein [Luteolibacter soli]|uniref:Uncharacterized protein n=1 Tax=Luteolibacter soli TaxID=3135280 RepID=A0ABU9AU93_9BACT